MRIIWDSEIYHYGMPRRSGRYKWGSGENPYHHGMAVPRDKIKKYDKLQKKLDKNQKKQDRLNSKLIRTDVTKGRVEKQEFKEKKIIAKMNKLDKKLEKIYMDNIDPNELKLGKGYLDSLDAMTKKIMDDYKGYDRLPYGGEASPNTYKGAREKAKALMDSRSKETINAIEKLGYKYNDTDVERYGNYNFEKTVKVKNGTKVDITAQTKQAPDKNYIQEVDNVVATNASKWVDDGKRKAVELNSTAIRDPKNVTSPYIVCRADNSGRKIETVDVSFINEEDGHWPSATYDMKKKSWSGSYDG